MPLIESTLAHRLLGSIEADRLVILAGAGLSMAPPSHVPGATDLAGAAAARFHEITLSDVPAGSERDLALLANFFLANHNLVSLFLNRLVEWKTFHRDHNKGHLAIADFLWCHAINWAITTNVDELVELASRELGEVLRQSLDGVEMNVVCTHASFLKLHGCAVRDKDNTLWSYGQLAATPPDPLVTRIRNSTAWLQANLPGRDLVFVGFWSDWAYLNRVLVDAISTTTPPLVVLVDPMNLDGLSLKAPDLSAWAGAQNFVHVPGSGAEFLDELRALFCRSFLNRLLGDSVSTYKTMSGQRECTQKEVSAALPTNDLFSLRRDTCGRPFGNVATEKRPTAAMKIAGATHLLLMNKGAIQEDGRYRLGGRRIRVVNGAGQLLSEIRAAFSSEPVSPQPDDFVVCAGAADDGGTPPNVLGRLLAPDIVRPGSAAKWITARQAFDTNFEEVA